MDMPKGTIVFTTIGRSHYGFDVFSTPLPQNLHDLSLSPPSEHRLTDGVSINFNAQFIGPDDNLNRLVYVSERTGSPRIYLDSNLLPSAPESLFHDRPIVRDGRLFFISAHEPADALLKSWSALYTLQLDDAAKILTRLTPYGCVDYSPSVSESGDFVAVASYGRRPWAGEFHQLQTDIVVFRLSDPANRWVVCSEGGWPTWSGDSVIYFHRQADDGWWSIYRLDLDLPSKYDFSGDRSPPPAPRRVTPPGIHCFTPAAMHSRPHVAVATRRKGDNYRHIEVFDVESNKFYPVTNSLNPNTHHYNPFVSPNSGFLGYHRYRGEAGDGESIIPHLTMVSSPIKGLRMLRLNGAFPSVSPAGDFIAFNPDLVASNSGVDIVKSDGSKRWTLLKGRTSFCNSWSPTEKNVIFTSVGPIFDSVKATVQIARITFDFQGEDNIKSEIKILTKEETGNNAFPSCSPDGKSLVFRSGRSGHKNLFILDAVEGEFKENDGGIRRLTEGPWIDTMPSWSPDGKLIAFSSNRHNPENPEAFSIYITSPDGSDTRRIYVAGGEDADRERINHVCFSADGEWLLFTANIGGVTAEPVSFPNQFQPYGDLYVSRLDGSGLRRLTWNGYENGTPTWHPELGSLRLNDVVGDKLSGQFDEPLWIKCDF